MIRKILLLILLTCPLLCNAQFKLNPNKLDGSGFLEFGKPDADQSGNKIRILEFDAGTNALKNKDESYKGLKKLFTDSKNFISLKKDNSLFLFWQIKENKVSFYLNPKSDDAVDLKTKTNTILFYCEKTDSFNKKEDDCKKAETKENDEVVYTDITQIPYPAFKLKQEKRADSKRNRYLVIDATANIKYKINNTVYKRRNPDSFDPTADFDKIFIEATPDVKGTLSVFIKNFNQSNIESIKVSLNGQDYAFTQGLEDIYDSVNTAKKELKENDKTNTVEESQSTGNNTKAVKEKQKARTKYLKKAYKVLVTGAKFLDHYQLNVITKYKEILMTTYTNKSLAIFLNEDGLKELSDIINWLPKELLLTNYSIKIPDTDEVDFTIEIKEKGTSNVVQNKVGMFRTTGGFSFNMSSNIYFTGLKNNEVFQETIDVNGTQQSFARLKDQNQRSLGIGVNGEVGFRTGGAVRPTFNIGFFIPISEDISPYLAIGPGLSLSSSKVKLTFSGGWAFGSVNAISQQYVDKDLTSFNLANDQLTDKIWDTSWFFSIGLNFLSLTNNKNK